MFQFASSLRLYRTLYRSSLSRRSFSSQTWPPPANRSKTTKTSSGYTHFNTPSAPTTSTTRYIFIASAAGIGIYLYSSLDRAPFTNRLRLLGVSRKFELSLGQSTYQDILQSFRGRILPQSHPLSQRVRTIVSRLAATATRLAPEQCEGFTWQIVVVADDDPNALCVPGGAMLITTGLLDILPTDDDIAVVLGHEMAHAVNRHGAEAMHLQRLLIPVVIILNSVLDSRWIPSILATVFLKLPYGRRLEHEADQVGLMLSTQACYNPRAAPGVFRRLGEVTKGGNVPEFLSTHPRTKEREKRLRAAAREMIRLYEEKCAVRGFKEFIDGVVE